MITQKRQKDYLKYKFYQKGLPKEFLKRKQKQQSYLNQSTIERSLLIHGQINLIKFVESNKFDKL